MTDTTYTRLNGREHEDQRLRRAEAGERLTVANAIDPLISRQVAAPGFASPKASGVLGKPSIHTANDDRPATYGHRGQRLREALPAGRYEDITPERYPASTRVAVLDPNSSEVGQTIMAMPAIISSRYAKGKVANELVLTAELREDRRPALPLLILGLSAAAAIVGVMYWGGGIDPLIANVGRDAPRTIIASLDGGPVPQAQPAAVLVPAAAASPTTANDDEVIAEGNQLLEAGDFAGARAMFAPLAQNGSADGAYGFARTFDPAAFLNRRVEGLEPDKPKAVEWYRRAAGEGSIEAKARLMAMETE